MAKSLSKHGMLGIVLLLFFWTLPASGYEVTNLTQLTNGSIQETGCAFNADSTKIAYRNMHSPYSWNNCDIWVMNTNGSGKTRITTDSRGEFDPRFAPDGRITYTKEFGSNNYDLWIVNGNGSNPYSLIGGSYRQTTCRWHPSGNKLVYCSEYQYQGPSEIWTANSDGSGKTQLTSHYTDGYRQGEPIYSHSGNLIAYTNTTTSTSKATIWVMNTDGYGKHQVASGSSNQTPMFWWPDDSRIGYTQNGEVWLHNLSNGTDEFLFSVPSGNIGWCDLSPDGAKLVFDSPDGHIWIGDVSLGSPEPSVQAIWSVDADNPCMGEPYRINVSLFAEESWPGGTVKLKLEETADYPSNKWNSDNDELLNDVGRWTCYVYPSPFDGNPPILVDEDYKIGSEEVELYLPPGGGVLPVANLYFEGSHKWAWIPPFNQSFIEDWISSVSTLVPGGFGAWLTWEAYQQTVNSSVQRLQYSYTGYCNGVSEEYFGDATVDGIPIYKQFALAESTGFAITASVPTAAALVAISSGGPLLILAPPVQAALISEAGLMVISKGLYIIAADPPNMDYTSITIPEIVLIPEIQEIGDPEFRNATLLVFKLEAVIRSMKDSMEKYEGAKLDGAIEWEVIQLATAKYYATKAQDITNDLATFWEEAVLDLPMATPEQIQQARDWIVENGLPDIEVNVLLALDYTQEEIDGLADVIASMDDTYFEGIDKLPDFLKVAAEGLEEIANKIPSVPESLAIEAVVDVRPDVLNRKSKGKWVTCYIELPEGYDVSDIDVNSLMLQNTVIAESKPTKIADYDSDGISDLMVKFDRQQFIDLLEAGEQVIALTGQLTDGTPLAGIDTIRVIH